jgi:hypothetical protein
MAKKFTVVLVALGLTVLSTAAMALSLINYPWYNNPYSYLNVYGCTWQNTANYGGSWGSQFNYVRTGGSCGFTRMQVNHMFGAPYAQVELS